MTEHPEPGADGWKQNCQRRQRRVQGLRHGRNDDMEVSTGTEEQGDEDEEEEEEEEKQ